MNAEIEVGDKWRFVPSANLDHSAGFGEILLREITGVVVEVNEAHRWFRVAFPCGTVTGHECFKF